MTPLVLHLFGEHVLQSQWMLENKRRSHIAALIHAALYALPFLLVGKVWGHLDLGCSLRDFAAILSFKYACSKLDLVRYLIYARNMVLSPLALSFDELDEIEAVKGSEYHARRVAEERRRGWDRCRSTGFSDDLPPHILHCAPMLTESAVFLIFNWYILYA